ncbi:uncharacterized protein B0P05DRAFT_504577 [Gilbertella persicaria]|uniref:uncharacterized protein n=1 Tax=Gilbertella persicaria TaxID=101096 RepID=UPI00221F22CD|nr:uncharacterized protein B0P05DRAFT_504577 [Gilbertella persicaria]KAI8091018.1 hypothetical protein B0P05DRAFT_504577 [Gilbertella persicaria]
MEPTQPSSSSTEINNTNKKRHYRRRNNNNNNNNNEKSRSDTSDKNNSDKNNNDKKKHQKQQQKKEPLKGFKKKPIEDSEEDAEGEVCFICTRPIDYYAVAPCDHRTCHLCTLRLRALYGTKNCAYCKIEANKVVFTNDSEKPYETYKRQDTPFYHKKYDIRFETKEMYKETLILLQYNCPEQDCEEAFENWNELKRHVKQVHERVCCDLCLRNKKIFSHEHTLYTNAQLQKHYREGDASFNKEDETGFTGHPECVFCRTRFYGPDELFEHCRDKHEQCHLCVRHGIQHQYYANYDSLEKHFNKEHYLCQYKECLENKFVVFDTDIDLKAHEVKEHVNTLSRQQRAKQSRVDVNLNYTSSQPQQQRGRQAKKTVQLSAQDFPDINGSVNPNALLSSRMASTSLSEPQEQWPTLGEEVKSSSSEPETAVVSRHAAALDRIADMIKSVDKVIKFRQYVTKYTSLSMDAASFVNSIYGLCDQDMDLTDKVIAGAKDLIDNRALKSDIIHAWNIKKNPSLSNDTHSPRVLIVDPKRSQSKKKKGVWDKVASAAIDAGGIRPPSFPPLQSKTPWSGSSTPRTASDADLQQLFPALPTSSGTSRRADINALLRKPHQNAWNESTTNEEQEEEEEESNTKKKKGKKGKQVLFRVGL